MFLRRSHPPAECYVLDTCCVSSRKPGTNGGLLCGRAHCCSLGYCELLLRVCAQVSESAVFILLNLIPLKAIGANKDFNTCFYCTLLSVPSCPLIPLPPTRGKLVPPVPPRPAHALRAPSLQSPTGGGSCFRRTRCERTQPLLSASGRVRVAAGLERLSRGSPCAAAAACGGGRPGR